MAAWVELTASDGHKFKAWQASPQGKAKGAIVVIQEIFGVNHHIRDVTERFAKEGYLAIAPALFDRYQRDFDVNYGPEDMQKAMQVVPKIDIAKGMLDTEAARAAVASAGKVGIVGYCFGGVVAWLGASRLKFDAASCYYGGRIAALKDEKPKCPVIMHFGSKDAHIPMTMVDEIRKAQPNVPIYVYDADHGFSCDERASFDKAAHDLAWTRTMKLFRENVG
ncbi:MAG: dienelactone hydrolase family protein [Alphaproteobacteria bacterium]|nr:dienelactone hydrolase family protein [Alphaproteobacteria bacterium]